MKKILYSLSLLCIAFASSCTHEWPEDANTVIGLEPGTITLTLQTVELQTKAPQEGEDYYNENLIQSVHYFFYPKDGTDSNTEKEPAKMGQVTNLSNVKDQHVINVNASEDEIKNELFKYPYNDCDVYVIVNLPENKLQGLTDHKLSTLKNIALEASFESSIRQNSFVMAGEGVASVEDRNKVLAAKGAILVDRVAAKITVSVKVKNEINLEEEIDKSSGMKWTPNPDKMTIELVNGVNRAVLSGDPQKADLDGDGAIFTDSRTFNQPEGEETWWKCEPFYTYPIKWDIGSDEEPHLFITLPWTTEIWTEVGGVPRPVYEQYECYYKIMLGSNELKKNTWYDLKINIGMLGSFENTPEVVLPIDDVNYFVADWSTGLTINSEILGARYLVVDKEEYVLYNQETLTIPFTTSHECVIIDEKCTYPNFRVNPATTLNEDDFNVDLVGGTTISFSHKLNNDMLSKEMDFTRFTTTFTIQHSDDPAFKKEITIIQYPAIYVEAYDNTDNTNGNNYNTDYGFVWVNGYQGSGNSNQDIFGGSSGLSQSTADRRMFVFTVTTTEGTDYIIGDPRTVDYTYTDASAKWYIGDAIYEGTNDRELKYYYGTEVASEKYSNANNNTGNIYANDKDAAAAEPTFNMIAPKFRLASGYGAVSQPTTGCNNLETLKKRCASYQEDGYPAGRWRLPTRAEFEFIFRQITYENLPAVYVENTNYWCAHGLGQPNNGEVTMRYIGYNTQAAYTRCVYDEWYWENSETYRLGTSGANGTFTPSDTFTWGDIPRDQFDAKIITE